MDDDSTNNTAPSGLLIFRRARGNPRAAHGAANQQAVLTWEKVAHIRGAGRTMSLRTLASMHGVSFTTIHNVRIGNNWKEEHRPAVYSTPSENSSDLS